MTLRAGGEMADTLPLGGSAARHGGSSPLPPTQHNTYRTHTVQKAPKRLCSKAVLY